MPDIQIENLTLDADEAITLQMWQNELEYESGFGGESAEDARRRKLLTKFVESIRSQK